MTDSEHMYEPGAVWLSVNESLTHVVKTSLPGEWACVPWGRLASEALRFGHIDVFVRNCHKGDRVYAGNLGDVFAALQALCAGAPEAPEVLGYDCDGTPVHAGDLIKSGPSVVRVLRRSYQQPTDDRGLCYCVVETVYGGYGAGLDAALRATPAPADALDHHRTAWRLVGSHAPAPRVPRHDVFETLDEWL